MATLQATTPELRRLVRRLARSATSTPVEVVAGADEPAEAGEGYYWTTPGGKRIRYPNAYKWPKVYVPSSIRVEVGREWLMQIAHAASVVRDALADGRQIQIDVHGLVAETRGQYVEIRSPLCVRKPWRVRAARLDVWGWA